MTPSLTPEQLLIVADEFCETRRVQVRDFGALVAAAAVPGAHIAGVPVYAGVPAAARALETTVIQLEPLSECNQEFGRIAREVYQRIFS